MFASNGVRPPVRPQQPPAVHHQPQSQRQVAQQNHVLAPQQQVSTNKRRSDGFGGFLKKRWWLVAIVAVLLAAVSVLGYGYVSTRNELMQLSKDGGASSAGTDAEKLVREISVYLQLPDETPTLANVSDASKLKGQDFFKDAQNGDKVLIFPKSSRALIYRPSTKKVIEYSKVDLSKSTAPTPAP